MLFIPDRTPIKPIEGGECCEWPLSYFMETEPEKRKQMLDQRTEEDELTAQLNKLFHLRYEKDGKTGKYADLFLREWMNLRIAAENLDRMFSEKKNRKMTADALNALQLGENSQFDESLIYQEMCQMTRRYIVLCSGDINYTAVLWGLGKQSDEKIRQKIELGLERIGKLLPKYLQMEEEFRVLTTAISDTKKEYLAE